MTMKIPLKKIKVDFSFSFGARLKIHLLFFVVLAAALFGGYQLYFGLAYAAALLHECAHILAAKCLKIKISHIEIQPFGICAVLNHQAIEQPQKEILVAAAGPLCSLVLAYLSYLAAQFFPFMQGELLPYALPLNLSLALLNLLPALPLDGGRILKALLYQKLGCIKAYNITIKISRIFVFLLLLSASLLLLCTRFNFSLLLVGVFLLGNLSAEQKNLTLLAMKELSESKERFLRRDIHKVKSITVRDSLPARKILPHLQSDHYFIIYVTDENARIIKTLTETQVIDSLIHKSIRITIGEVK